MNFLIFWLNFTNFKCFQFPSLLQSTFSTHIFHNVDGWISFAECLSGWGVIATKSKIPSLSAIMLLTNYPKCLAHKNLHVWILRRRRLEWADGEEWEKAFSSLWDGKICERKFSSHESTFRHQQHAFHPQLIRIRRTIPLLRSQRTRTCHEIWYRHGCEASELIQFAFWFKFFDPFIDTTKSLVICFSGEAVLDFVCLIRFNLSMHKNHSHRFHVHKTLTNSV